MSTLTSGTATDLVNEIRSEQRQQQRRRVVRVIVALVALVTLLVAGKILFDRHRLSSNLDTCRRHLAGGSQEDLDRAEAALRANLAMDAGHGRSLVALSLVQANRALVFGTDPAVAKTALEELDSSSSDARLAQIMLALVEGRREEARTLLAELDDSDALLPHAGAWLRARLALHTPADPGVMGTELQALTAVVEGGAANPEYARTAAGLAFRTGDVDGAAKRIVSAREQHPANLGLAVDELLFDAELHRRPAELEGLAEALLDRTDLAPPDRARVGLARTLIACHEARKKECTQGLKDAWSALPRWDHDARDRTLATAIFVGQAKRIRSWLEDGSMGDTMTGIYDAGASFAEGAMAQTLEALQSLPQEHPRVAELHALALIELERADEAGPWLDRADALLPERPALAVARARLAKDGAGLESLLELAQTHTGAFRVHTATGQAHLAGLVPDADKSAKNEIRAKAADAFQTALKSEPWPAEAALQLSILEMIKAWKKPAKAADALELLERAVKFAPDASKYTSELGIYLADLGFDRRAEPLLRKITEAPDPPARGLLRLVRLLSDRGPLNDEDLAASAKWLAAASKAGATPNEIQRHQARIEIAQRQDALLDAAYRRLSALLEADRKDLETRILLSEVLLRRDLDEAKSVLRVGLRLTPRSREARIHYRLARVEKRKRKARNAAGMSFRAFRAMIKERRPPFEVFEVANFTRDLWLEIGQIKGARTIGRDLSEYAPYHPASWVLRGRIQLAADYPDWALESAQKALELNDEYAPAQALLGECLAQRGKTAAAREAYEKAVKFGDGMSLQRVWRSRLKRLGG